MKKVLSVLLSICLLLSILTGAELSASAMVFNGNCGDKVLYSYDSSNETLTIYGSGPMWDYDYYADDYSPFTKLYERLQNDYSYEITNVVIEPGVTTIGASAFFFMDIESVEIPDTVVSIGDCAFFWNCNRLNNVVIPNSVKTIGVGAFNQCYALCDIKLPNTIEKIGEYAFYNTGYTFDESNAVNAGYYIGNYLIKVDWDLSPDNSLKVKNGTILISDWAITEDLQYYGKEYNVKLPKSLKYIGEWNFPPDSISNISYSGSYSDWKKIDSNASNEFHKLVCTDKTVYNHSYYTTIEEATSSSNGKIITTCRCGDVSSRKTIYKASTIKLSASNYTYDGNAKKPGVIIKDSNGNTISSSNYSVSYASGRKNVGKYSVKVTFKGNYSGKKTLYFKINPKSTSISSVTAVSKGFTVKWKKQATQTTGYEIQYSTDKNFKKNNKKTTVSNNSTTSKKITKLTGKKKYYVRIRTYKTVNGDKCYSAWSSAKAVTTKR